jgi:hypothetical protein
MRLCSCGPPCATAESSERLPHLENVMGRADLNLGLHLSNAMPLPRYINPRQAWQGVWDCVKDALPNMAVYR